mmetsp:Transcript_30010/g.72278  ORF Transcript_30010/g.72278 Transcript_30010/m.72278 type:complete len:207 (-) Transcript_30010:19-639(-)
MLLRQDGAAVRLVVGRPGERAGEGAAGDEACVDGAGEDGEGRHERGLVGAERVVEEAAQLAVPAPAARRRPQPLRHPDHVRQPLHEPVLRNRVRLDPHCRQQLTALVGAQPFPLAVLLQEHFDHAQQADVVVRRFCFAVRRLERALRQRLAPALARVGSKRRFRHALDRLLLESELGEGERGLQLPLLLLLHLQHCSRATRVCHCR